jgi:drug/metabolite transporter (DMT)-like permease
MAAPARRPISPHHARAVRLLATATLFWGLSFPVMKSIGALQQQLVPDATTWFLTSLTVSARFVISALIIGIVAARTLPKITWLEIYQGGGLGFFGGIGLIFQMDGLNYVHASTSAFLTQSYCVLIPIIAAVRDRRPPSIRVVVCTLVMVTGIAILTQLNPRDLQLGRGEIETLIGSLIFTGQILWLERPIFAHNNVNHFSFAMFVITAMVSIPCALATMRQPSHIIRAFDSFPLIMLVIVLVLFCTMTAYMMMNRWQPHVTATEAGLLYGLEPVFASIFALFLPSIISSFAHIDYPSERLTMHLFIGGVIIVLANVALQLKPPAKEVIPDEAEAL